MNRRDFLKMLGVGIVAPKLIFDMGKNSRLYSLLKAHPRLIIPAVDPAFPENVVYFMNGSSIELIDDHVLDASRYHRMADSVVKENCFGVLFDQCAVTTNWRID